MMILSAMANTLIRTVHVNLDSFSYFISSGREMVGNLFIDSVNMLLLVILGVFIAGHVISETLHCTIRCPIIYIESVCRIFTRVIWIARSKMVAPDTPKAPVAGQHKVLLQPPRSHHSQTAYSGSHEPGCQMLS